MSNVEEIEPSPGVAEGSALVPPRRSWQYGIAPHYIGLFLWIVFSDRLGRTTLPIGGLGFSLLGALLAGLLCNELLFKGLAHWGHFANRTTMELCPRVFGRGGARLVGCVIGLAEIVWFAVGITYATEWTLDGLIALDFFDSSILQPFPFGSYTLPSKLFLLTSLFWCFAVALTATWLVRVIGAIMNVYPLFPAFALAAAMFALLGGVSHFTPTGIDPLTGRPMPSGQGSLIAILRMIQMIFGFFAMAGVMSVDWGKGSQSAKDIQIGGWVGVVFAPLIVAAITLLTVVGYQGKVAPVQSSPFEASEPGVPRRSQSVIIDVTPPAPPPPLVLRDAIRLGIGGKVAGMMLLILGLGALAPSVYSAFKYAHRFKEAIGGISRVAWMLVATTLSWPLIAIGATKNLEAIFSVMGAVFAPMAAAYLAISIKDRRTWTGERAAFSFAGMAGWLVGIGVGVLPMVPGGAFASLQPAALWAFVASFLITRVFSAIGWESRRLEGAPTILE